VLQTTSRPPPRRPARVQGALGALLAVLLVTSCAYFNTFYNAKAEFRKAESERKNAPVGGGDAAYQKCIEKCQSLLRYYGKSKYVDDALFLIGMSRYQRGEYIQARASFEDLAERFPKSEYLERAMYWSGLAALRQGDAANAALSFERLAAAFPKSKFNDEAIFRTAEARLEAHDYERAREDLRAFMTAHPKSDLSAEAQLRLARTYYEEDRLEEAQTEYAKVLERNPSNDIRYEAQLNMALALRSQAEAVLANPALQRMRRERTAEAARQSMMGGVVPKKPPVRKPPQKKPGPSGPAGEPGADVEMPPEDVAAGGNANLTPAQVDSVARAEAETDEPTWTAEDEAQLKIAEGQVEQVWAQLVALRKPAAKLGRQAELDLELAVTRALRGEPDAAQDDLDQIARTQPRTDLAARARYEIGEILRRQGDFSKARAAYDESLREKRDAPVAAQAQRKSSAIVLRTTSQDKLRGAKPVVKRWRDAEAGRPLEPDPKQKGARPAEPGTEGKKSAKGDARTGADAKDPVADSLGAVIAAQAEFESMAAEQLRVAEIDLLDLDQPLVALREFERVLTDYHGSLQGPRAAFAVAWIHDRRLHDATRARAAYERLVQDYPQTPQGREAQFVLEHWDEPGARPEVKNSFLRR